MALIELAEYKAFMGIQSGDTRNDPQINALLEAASRAVISYTGRNFEPAEGSSTRTYLYDGSGFLDIDDCTDITSVEVATPNATTQALSENEYTVMPSGGEVSHYLILHGGVSPYGISPEMGFTYNLDTYPMIALKQPTVQVTATWGWEEVPQDVKLATALTVSEVLSGTSGGHGEGLTAEAIEGWSRAWGSRQGGMTALMIPNRARDLLVNYQRMYV